MSCGVLPALRTDTAVFAQGMRTSLEANRKWIAVSEAGGVGASAEGVWRRGAGGTCPSRACTLVWHSRF